MKPVTVVLVLLSGALALGVPCGPGLVAVPTHLEAFECFLDEKLDHLKRIEAAKRFDANALTLFYLWTQQANKTGHEELVFNDLDSLKSSSFDPRNPTRLLTHGWLSDWTAESVDGLAKAYVAKGAYNVIGIDWSAGASTANYLQARVRVDAVASTVAKQIQLLLRAGQKPSQIVFIGHSLGAHIAGLTGKHFPGPQKLAAVIALDPAGPLFHDVAPSERVDRFDADYVEVIHTNMGLLGHGGTLGEADFFPNGGRAQAGCLTTSCNHHRAVEYFHKSLESSEPVYTGRRCDTESVNEECSGVKAVMASDPSEPFKEKTSGVFYLKIDDELKMDE